MPALEEVDGATAVVALAEEEEEEEDDEEEDEDDDEDEEEEDDDVVVVAGCAPCSSTSSGSHSQPPHEVNWSYTYGIVSPSGLKSRHRSSLVYRLSSSSKSDANGVTAPTPSKSVPLHWEPAWFVHDMSSVANLGANRKTCHAFSKMG